jgi:hypothetical protein
MEKGWITLEVGSSSYRDSIRRNNLLIFSPPAPGKSAVKSLLSPQYKKLSAKKAPKIETEEEAEALLAKMLPQ